MGRPGVLRPSQHGIDQAQELVSPGLEHGLIERPAAAQAKGKDTIVVVHFAAQARRTSLLGQPPQLPVPVQRDRVYVLEFQVVLRLALPGKVIEIGCGIQAFVPRGIGVQLPGHRLQERLRRLTGVQPQRQR
jgi:hypothetical protein